MPAKSRLRIEGLEGRIHEFLDSLPTFRPRPDHGAAMVISRDPIPVILIAAEKAGKISKAELGELIDWYKGQLGEPANYHFQKKELNQMGGEHVWVIVGG